jgi:hypothetical protein
LSNTVAAPTPAETLRRATSTPDEADGLRAEIRRVERAGRITSRALWVVAAGVMTLAAWSVTAFAIAHDVGPQVAWALDPLTGTALLVALHSEAILGKYGIRASGWGLVLRLLAGLSTWTMNVWQAAANRDPAAVVLHSVPPALLIVLAEAAPHYRRQFAAITTSLHSRLDAIAEADRDETDRIARQPQEQTARTAAAEHDRLAADRAARAERERTETQTRLALLETQRAQAEAAQAEAHAAVEKAKITAQAAIDVARTDASRTAAQAHLTRNRAAGRRTDRREPAAEQPRLRSVPPAPRGPAHGRAGDIEHRMREYWTTERSAGRSPTGADLDRAAGTTDYGRKLRRQLLTEETRPVTHVPKDATGG